MARVVQLVLQREGFETEVEESGAGGVAQALTGGFAVVILDLGLPDLDGLDVCQAIRAVSDTRILMLTARDAVEDRVAGLDAGADDYLVKPFAPQELAARVRALHRRPGSLAHADSPIAMGNWQISPLRREVRVDKEVYELTRREFDLLWYLVQNPGATLTRDMILDRVWGWSYGGDSNVIDVYVGYLRQKLPMGGPNPQIVTVRGVGYSLRMPNTPSVE